MLKRQKIDPYSALMEIAQAQQGYFTTKQAKRRESHHHKHARVPDPATDPLGVAIRQQNGQRDDAGTHAGGDPKAKYFGLTLNDQSLTPGANPRLGATRFATWLEQTVQK